MKVIFLDFDGVLNSLQSCHFFHRTLGGNGFGGFRCDPKKGKDDVKLCEYAVDNLKKILEETNAMIVVSSTWRKMFSVEELNFMLGLYGIHNKVVDITSVEWGECRGKEISDWMKNSDFVVSSYVILDDDTDMLSTQWGRFVHTSVKVGLTFEDAQKAVEILNG